MRYKPSGSNTSASVSSSTTAVSINTGLGSFSNLTQFNDNGFSGIAPKSENTYYNDKNKNLAGVFYSSSEIETSNDSLIFYIAVGLKNSSSLYIKNISSFDIFSSSGKISR